VLPYRIGRISCQFIRTSSFAISLERDTLQSASSSFIMYSNVLNAPRARQFAFITEHLIEGAGSDREKLRRPLEDQISTASTNESNNAIVNV
jgi:hypothetical protein